MSLGSSTATIYSRFDVYGSISDEVYLLDGERTAPVSRSRSNRDRPSGFERSRIGGAASGAVKREALVPASHIFRRMARDTHGCDRRSLSRSVAR
jgi:hypothetical protein